MVPVPCYYFKRGAAVMNFNGVVIKPAFYLGSISKVGWNCEIALALEYDHHVHSNVIFPGICDGVALST
jgi:hypothetical protein